MAETVSVVVNSHARVNFDGNRYSTPPEVARKTALLRASAKQVRILYQGQEVACHPRSYERGQLVRQKEHQLDALKMRHRVRATPNRDGDAPGGGVPDDIVHRLLDDPEGDDGRCRRNLGNSDAFFVL